jgi:hypothetical protein
MVARNGGSVARQGFRPWSASAWLMHSGVSFGLAVTAVVAGVAGCTSHSGTPKATPSIRPVPNSSRAADQGQLRVVDYGFEMVQPDTSALETNRVSFGVIVENTSKVQAAEGATLTIKLYDASNALVFGASGGQGRPYSEHLAAVYPGQRGGVGDELGATDAAIAGRTVVRMEVEVGTATWDTPDNVATATATDIKATTDSTGRLTITCSIMWNQANPWTAPVADAVFYNAAGKVIGGQRRSSPATVIWPVGKSTQQVDFKRPPPKGADLSKTEVYI